jgi:hypothetical protein
MTSRFLTDGDGVWDGDEVPHSPGSCPTDASDGGSSTNCVTLKLTVGDPSGSESERWNLEVFEEATGKAVVRHCDGGFGTPGSAEYALVKGKAYTFSLKWVATNLGSYGPDYDWQAKINDSTAEGAYSGLYGTGPFIVEDSHGLLTEYTDGGPNNLTVGKEGRIIVPKIVTETVATSPPDRARKTIGVGEEVTLTVLPDGIGYVDWEVAEGEGEIVDHYSEKRFIAPASAEISTLTASFCDTSLSVTLSIIQPQEVRFARKQCQTASWPEPGAPWFYIDYQVWAYLYPDTVNFSKLFLSEGESYPYYSGSFGTLTPIPIHQMNSGHPMSDQVRTGFGTRMLEPDNIRGYSPNTPCDSGTLDWHIRWSYQFGCADNEIVYVNQHYALTMRPPVPSTNGVFRVEKRPVGGSVGCAFLEMDSQQPGNIVTD